MAQRVELEVTAPVHGPGGVVAYLPGHRFASMTEVPEGVPVRPVIVQVPDEPAPEPQPLPEAMPEPEPSPAARPGKAREAKPGA